MTQLSFLQVSAAKIGKYTFLFDKNLFKILSFLTISYYCDIYQNQLDAFLPTIVFRIRFWKQNVLVSIAYVLHENQFPGAGYYCCANKCSLSVSHNSLILNIGYCSLAPNTRQMCIKQGKLSKLLLRKKKSIFLWKPKGIFLFVCLTLAVCAAFWMGIWVTGHYSALLFLLGDLGIRSVGYYRSVCFLWTVSQGWHREGPAPCARELQRAPLFTWPRTTNLPGYPD